MSGPKDRWDALRRPVADAILLDGSFLDIGCANGYLLECCVAWCAERGISIVPHGLDLSEPLLELARARLPNHMNDLHHGNALTWVPPMRYDVVHTALVYVPEESVAEYLERLRRDVVAPGGELLVSNYSERSKTPEREVTPGALVTTDIVRSLESLGFDVARVHDGDDPLGRRITRVAVLT